MMITPAVTSAGINPLAISESTGAAPQSGPGEVPFAGLVQQFLQDVNQQQLTVTTDVKDLVAGKTDNIHEIALHVAQADIAFRMALEVRDKLISAYQELMRMQV